MVGSLLGCVSTCTASAESDECRWLTIDGRPDCQTTALETDLESVEWQAAN